MQIIREELEMHANFLCSVKILCSPLKHIRTRKIMLRKENIKQGILNES